MPSWYTDQQKTIYKTINAVYDELAVLIESDYPTSANYWIDNRHNVFAEAHKDCDGYAWIDIYFELYDINGDIIADIDVMETEDKSSKSLKECIVTIVNEYYGE